MSYIGNQVTTVPHTIDVFSGNGTATSFSPMVRAPAGSAAIAVFISGVYKTPGIDYTVNGDTLIFSAAPIGGTNNIVVHHIGNGSASAVPSDMGVTGRKMAVNAIRANNIVAGTITGNLIAETQISGNLMQNGSVSGNNIVVNAIRANNIVAAQITGNLIAENQITGNLIGVRAVSGNQIGLGAISSNHYAGGGVTSDVLSANLTISTSRVAETVNVRTTAISGNYNIHVANSTVYYFVANTTGSVTFNLVANDGTTTGTTGSLDDLLKVGQTASVAIALKQGSTRYRANVFIDGVNPLTSVFWMGGSQPAQLVAQGQSIDSYNITVVKIAPAAYTIMVGNTTFAYANGQGMGPGGAQ